MFLHGNTWLELGSGCPLSVGHVLSTWTQDPLDTHSSFILLEWTASQLMTLITEQPQKGGKRHKRMAYVSVCTHTVGRKMQSYTFILVLFGQGARPPRLAFYSQPPETLLGAKP